MEFDDRDYVLGYWIASDKDDNNWYCFVKRSPDGTWHVRYTFRYHKNTDPWSDDDTKNIYSYEIKKDSTEEFVLSAINKLFDVIKIKFPEFSDHFLVQGDAKKCMEMLKKKDYIHWKSVQ